jgi:nucleotide-binding universal stress UspA family protein
MPGILVGVDGSDHSRQALGWAMREAARHHLPLTVMSVRPAPPRPATHIFWNIPILPEDSHDPDQARAAVQEFVDKVAHEVGEPVPDVTVTVITGDPAEELIRASHDADMLIVGARGNGSFAELLLGSVSSKVMHHSACPTVVVPGNRHVQASQRG